MSFMPKNSSSESDFCDGWTVVEQNYCSEEILEDINILETYFDKENILCPNVENCVHSAEDYANDADAETDAVSTSEKDETTANSKISKSTRKKIKSRSPSPKPSNNETPTNSRTRTPKKYKTKINRPATPPNTPRESSITNLHGTKKSGNYTQEQKSKLNKPSTKKKFYRHHRNSKINNVFNLILAGAVVTAAGLAFGHLLGLRRESATKIEKPSAHVSLDVTKLQKENQMLKFQLDEIRRLNSCRSKSISRYAESISNQENEAPVGKIRKCIYSEKLGGNHEKDLFFKNENKTNLNNKTKRETDTKNSIKTKNSVNETISKITDNSNLVSMTKEQGTTVYNTLTDTKKTGIIEEPAYVPEKYENYCATPESCVPNKREATVSEDDLEKKIEEFIEVDINNNNINTSLLKSNDEEDAKHAEKKLIKGNLVINLDTRAKKTIKELEEMNSDKTDTKQTQKQNNAQTTRPADKKVQFKSGTPNNERKTRGTKCSAQSKSGALRKYNKAFGQKHFAGVCRAQNKNEKYNKWEMKRGYMYDLEEESNNDYDDNFFEENVSQNRKTLTLNDVLVNNSSLKKTEAKEEFVKGDGMKATEGRTNKILDEKNMGQISVFVEYNTTGKCKAITNPTTAKTGKNIGKCYSEVAKASLTKDFEKGNNIKPLKCCSEMNNQRQTKKAPTEQHDLSKASGRANKNEDNLKKLDFCTATVGDSKTTDILPKSNNLTITVKATNLDKQQKCDIEETKTPKQQHCNKMQQKKTTALKLQVYDCFTNGSDSCYKPINYKKQCYSQQNHSTPINQPKKTWSKKFNTCPRKV